MAKPTNKVSLINDAQQQYTKLMDLITKMSNDQKNATFAFVDDDSLKEAHWHRDKKIKDVVTHVYEWQVLLLDFEKSNSQGIEKPFLPAPYTWKTYGKMNEELWEKHQTTDLDVALTLLSQSHEAVINVCKKYNDEQLFTKGLYKWCNTTSLGQYLISTTVSHYEWAIKKIKKHLKYFE